MSFSAVSTLKSLNINKDEVDTAFTVSIDDLVSNSRSTKFRFSPNSHLPTIKDYEIAAYETSPRVWGLTAMYTNFVLSIMTNGAEKFIGTSGIRIFTK